MRININSSIEEKLCSTEGFITSLTAYGYKDLNFKDIILLLEYPELKVFEGDLLLSTYMIEEGVMYFHFCDYVDAPMDNITILLKTILKQISSLDKQELASYNTKFILGNA